LVFGLHQNNYTLTKQYMKHMSLNEVTKK